jgi:hypothetical protein
MRIVPDVEDPAVESTLHDLARQAEILKDLMIGLTDHFE